MSVNHRKKALSSKELSEDYVLSETLDDGTKVVIDPQNDIHRLRCAGLDVHKDSIVAAVCITNPKTLKPKYYVKTFGTMNSEIIRMAEYLKLYQVRDVCMESTGKYWIPIYDQLQVLGLNPVLTHPKYVKQVLGKKTDLKDAINITNMFRSGHVTPSFVPPEDIRALREIIRYSIKLVSVRTSEKTAYRTA